MSRHVSLIKKVLIIICLCLVTAPAFAETVTFTKEYTYQASDFDSRHSSRTLSLETVKRLLLEELGTYLISETEVKNMHLTKDQVTTYSAGIVSAEVIDEKWDGKSYWLKSKVSADPVEVAKSVDKLRNDHQKTKELEETRKRAAELSQEIEKLKKELDKAKTNSEKSDPLMIKQYDEAVNKLGAADWFEKGYILQENDKHKEAIEAFTKAIELTPKNSAVYLFRGHSFNSIKNYLRAIDDYSKILILYPNFDNTYLVYRYRADMYKALGRYNEAFSDLESMLAHQSPSSLFLYGWESEDFDDIAKKTKNSKFYIIKGLLNYTPSSVEGYNTSIECFNKVIKLNPKYSLAYWLRGYTNFIASIRVSSEDKQGKKAARKHALSDLNKAISLGFKPKFSDFYNTRGKLNSFLDKYQEAISNYSKEIEFLKKEIIEKSSTYSSKEFLFIQGFLFTQGNRSNIVNNAKDSIASAYSSRGEQYLTIKKYNEALDDFNSAIAIRELLKDGVDKYVSDDWHKDYLLRGDAYCEIGIYKNAINDYNKALELVPEYPLYADDKIDIQFKRGNAYFNLEDYLEAIRDFNKVLELNPKFAAAYNNIGAAYYNSGNHQEGIKNFKIAARLNFKVAQDFLKNKGISW